MKTSAFIYDRINDFCQVRNRGSVRLNDEEPTPRVKYLLCLLDELGIQYELDKFRSSNLPCYNIVLRGTSGHMVVAHHDVANANVDNANDNSASVINAIAVKYLSPETHVVILDGEEVGGLGAQRCAERIKAGDFGEIDWVLNLELSGSGGHRFFIGDYPGKLSDLIVERFDCPIVSTPFNDSVVFRKHGIDSVVINPLPLTKEGEESDVVWKDGSYLDFSLLKNCHSSRDTIDTVSSGDMREFVEEVLIKILEG